MEDRVALLVALLQDHQARPDERDDAAMNLAAFDNAEAFEGLLGAACDPGELDLVVASAGESLAEIALRTGRSVGQWMGIMRPEAAAEVQAVLARAPHLLAE